MYSRYVERSADGQAVYIADSAADTCGARALAIRPTASVID
jgi:hypothetical protein